MTLHELYERLKVFHIEDEIQETVIVTSEAITTLNKGQMSIGLLSDNTPIKNLKQGGRTYYSLWWGEHRFDLGLQIDFYDFRVTGEFYRSLFVSKVTKEDYTIDAHANQKKENLLKLFGPDIFGLTDDSLDEEYIPLYFFPELKQRIETKLGVEMV